MLVFYMNSRLNRRSGGGEGTELPATAWRQFPALLFAPAVAESFLMQYRKIEIPNKTDCRNRSKIHECKNWKQDLTVSFLGVCVSNFGCSFTFYIIAQILYALCIAFNCVVPNNFHMLSALT
jgi:hypothetical protein